MFKVTWHGMVLPSQRFNIERIKGLQWTLGIYQTIEFKQGRTAIRGAVKQQFDYRKKTRGSD